MSDRRNTEEAWSWIVRWLAENAPASHATLRPGVSEGRMVRTEEQLGFPLCRLGAASHFE
jgi:cell wall assembly regulator SMI1